MSWLIKLIKMQMQVQNAIDTYKKELSMRKIKFHKKRRKNIFM